MVLWIRSRLSLRFWMADADISLEILCDTESTIIPKRKKIKIMGKSRGNFPCLYVLGIFFIDNPHSTALQGAVCSYGRK